MKATETSLLKFLQAPKQFTIPIYQRTYSWTEKQCQQLWDDIVRVAKDESVPSHFIGSIVYIEKGIYQAASVPKLLVIDGQQRLATISLLLSVLAKRLDDDAGQSDITRKQINNYFLFNNEETGDLRYKLMLTQSDKNTFACLIEGKELPQQVSRRLVENYQFFERKTSEDGIDPRLLHHGIAKLIVVDVSLDRNYDNPQLIFESLNSTGLDLTQADLIRNYILMGLEPDIQNELYTNCWFPMEQSFSHAEYAQQFDRFTRDYLTMKSPSGSIPRIEEVYINFKKFAQGKDIKETVTDVWRYSKYWVRMAFSKNEEDTEIRNLFRDINTLRVDVAYPLILEIYEDYHNKRLSRDEFIEILKIVESYVFRRAICGIPTNSLNKTFATLSRGIDKANYLESIQAAFLLRISNTRFPRDEEMSRELVVKDIYNFRNRNYLLRKLENYDRKESVDLENYTIEHIMPQNEDLSPEWQAELGSNWKDIQAKWLHTIGNLTLTGYNPELSDKSFREKRDMKGGFRDSPIRLNHSLASLDQWNDAEIQQRAQELASVAVKIWPIPKLSPEILSKYSKPSAKEKAQTYTLEHFSSSLQDDVGELFNMLRKRILNLDSSVKEEVKKFYIAYKTTTNFVDVVPQKRQLRLSLNMEFSEVNDPEGLCKDVSKVGRWGNGDVEVVLSSPHQIEYVMSLIRQSFDKYYETAEG
jgi:uncharacterized protein with ParB-like and HNH nuclease domain/predicted transport protein